MADIYFEGIDLPPAADDEPGSHGYVTFRIRPRSNLQDGAVISNQARIYFDFNQPVETNSVNTTFSQLATTSFSRDEIGIYPNPATQSVTVSVSDPAKLSDIAIYNALGQLVKRLSTDKNSLGIDISELNSGTYFVKVASDKGTVTKKLIKL